MSRNFGISRRQERAPPGQGGGRCPRRLPMPADASRRGTSWASVAMLATLAGALWALSGCALAPVPNYEPGLMVFCQAHPHAGTCP